MSKKTPERLVRDEFEAMLCEHQQTDLKGVVLWSAPRGIMLFEGRAYKVGGMPGQHDYIGYASFVITPDMVGSKISRFLEAEAKKPGEVPSPVQKRHMDKVNRDGGLAGWFDSAESGYQLLRNFKTFNI